MAISRIISIPPHGKRGSQHNERMQYVRDIVMPYDGDDCLIWPFSRTPGGYGQIRVNGKTGYVTRLICQEMFGPPPSPKHHAAHSCGNGSKGCCTKRHLRWASPAENIQDKFKHGTIIKGEAVAASKLTVDQVRHIKSFKGVLTQMEIAAYFGVSQTNISQIFLGKIWRDV